MDNLHKTLNQIKKHGAYYILSGLILYIFIVSHLSSEPLLKLISYLLLVTPIFMLTLYSTILCLKIRLLSKADANELAKKFMVLVPTLGYVQYVELCLYIIVAGLLINFGYYESAIIPALYQIACWSLYFLLKNLAEKEVSND